MLIRELILKKVILDVIKFSMRIKMKEIMLRLSIFGFSFFSIVIILEFKCIVIDILFVEFVFFFLCKLLY